MLYNNILVPLDGSKGAEAVLTYVRFLAGALKLPVDLIRVNETETPSQSIQSKRQADYLNETAASFLSGLRVNGCVKNGAAAEVILDTASADAGTLIAMATHGQSSGQRWLLGRVSQKVLQASRNPLILIRSNGPSAPGVDVQLGTIIVPLDGSHLAEQIFPHVCCLATSLGLRVVLIQTYVPPTAGYFIAAHVSPSDVAGLADKIKQEVKDYLQLKVEELRARGAEKASFVLAEGNGPSEIIDLARNTSGSIVAMSTHGRSGMGRWVLGSVTDRVVSYCANPVLVVRPPSSPR